MALVIAGQAIDEDEAFGLLREYGVRYRKTVEFYDHGGRDYPNGVTLADIGRLVVINGRPTASDVGVLIDAVLAEEWQELPLDATFLELPSDLAESTLYARASGIYRTLTKATGIGMTKATKLMHLKRPDLVPIVDSVAEKVYREAAIAARIADERASYWPVIWREAKHNEERMPTIRSRLLDAGSPVAALPSLRLHDMLLWMRAQN
jgi:hypothetical protein